LKHLAKFKNIGGTFIEVLVESKEEGYEEYPLKTPSGENLYTLDQEAELLEKLRLVSEARARIGAERAMVYAEAKTEVENKAKLETEKLEKVRNKAEEKARLEAELAERTKLESEQTERVIKSFNVTDPHQTKTVFVAAASFQNLLKKSMYRLISSKTF
jgi:hypothetical protein